MTLDDYNVFCASLGPTTTVVQWGGAHVWKIGGKVFAIAREDDDGFQCTFKCSDIAYHALQDYAGCRPAPYLASRGMKWIQRYETGDMDDAMLKAHIEASFLMIAKALPKKKRAELHLDL